MSKTFNKNISFVYNTGANLRLSSSTNTIGNIFTIGGSVGIGTTSPNAQLDISSSELATLRLSGDNQNTTGYDDGRIQTQIQMRIDNLLSGFNINCYNGAGSHALAIEDISNVTVGNIRMYIDGTGNVGFGTTNPISSIDLGATADSKKIGLAVQTTNFWGLGANSSAIQYQVPSTSAHRFYTGSTTTALGTERVCISSSGNVGIGTGTPSSRFHVNLPASVGNGNVYFGATGLGYPPFGADCSVDNGVVGFLFNPSSTSPKGLNIYYNGVSNGAGASYFICNDNNSLRFQVLGNGNVQNANNSYGATSDIKIKENIVDATPKLDDLMKVKIRNFNRIDDSTKQIGVIAQELESVFPGLVEETKDVDKDNKDLGTTTKAVKYSVFIPILIKAMQELKTENDALKAFINQKFPDANL